LIQLILGDSNNELSNFSDKSIPLIVTDIPYNEVNRNSNGLRNLDKGEADSAEFDLPNILKNIVRICYGSVYMFCGIEQVSEIRKHFVKSGMSSRLLIWEKINPSPMNGQHIWLSGIECCVFGKYKGGTFNAHCRNSVLRYPTERNIDHATPKPICLMKDIIEVSSNPGDTILDPFMGSGSTGVAAKILGRGFIGIEKNEEFFSYAKNRIESTEHNLFV